MNGSWSWLGICRVLCKRSQSVQSWTKLKVLWKGQEGEGFTVKEAYKLIQSSPRVLSLRKEFGCS